MDRLPLQSQATYSELVEALTVAESTGLADDEGSLTRRTVSGKPYWYLRRRIGNRIRERYLGAESDELLIQLDALEQRSAEAKVAARNRRILIRMLRSAGYATVPRRVGRVFEELAVAGVFRLEGLLVGSHAFALYGALLGVRLNHSLAVTNDVDIAQDDKVNVAVIGQISPKLSEALSMAERFIEVAGFDPRTPSTSWHTVDHEIRVDLLTTLRGREREGPVRLPALGAHATALRFLDFLLEDSVRAAVLTGSGVLVRVPTPERFALHKLLVSTRRGPSFRQKAAKDLAQASALMQVLLIDASTELADAWDDLRKRGKSWEKACRQAGKKLPEGLWDEFLAVMEE